MQLFGECHVGGTNSVLEKDLGWGCAYVRPVERLMPARKAETGSDFSRDIC